MLSNTTALIFDFDGVILDTVSIKTEAFAELYAPYGEGIQQRVVEYHHAHGGISRYEKFRVWERDLLGRNPSEADIEALAQRFSELVFRRVLAANFIPGVRTFLDRVYQTIPCYVCTGTPDVEIQRIIDARGFRPWFREVCGSPRRKPEIIRYLLKKYDHAPAETIFFGDAMTDYNAATQTGLRFIGIESPETVFPEGTEVWGGFG